jgi:hypothetical protein
LEGFSGNVKFESGMKKGRFERISQNGPWSAIDLGL